MRFRRGTAHRLAKDSDVTDDEPLSCALRLARMVPDGAQLKRNPHKQNRPSLVPTDFSFFLKKEPKINVISTRPYCDQ